MKSSQVILSLWLEIFHMKLWQTISKQQTYLSCCGIYFETILNQRRAQPEENIFPGY